MFKLSRFKNLRTPRFHNYMMNDFAEDVESLLESDHPMADEWKHYEGTLRSAAWAVLRLRLPRAWCVEAEVPYPVLKKRADVIIWPTLGDRQIILEVKRENRAGIQEDAKKLQAEIRRVTSPVWRAYLLFLVPWSEFDDESDVDAWVDETEAWLASLKGKGKGSSNVHLIPLFCDPPTTDEDW